jgi:hypothetical protein
MKRIALPALLAAVLAAGPTRGQTTTTPFVFVTVDAVALQSNRLVITGILEGEAVPVERWIQSNLTDSVGWMQACEKLALLAMTRPGQYRLEIGNPPPSLSTTCKLSKASP